MEEGKKSGKVPFRYVVSMTLEEKVELQSRFEDMLNRSSSLLWERTGRHYVSGEGSENVRSDIRITHTSERDRIIRTLSDGREIPYAEFDIAEFVGEGETTITVYNPDAEEIIAQEAQRQGLIKRDLPEGVTLNELGFMAELYDDGSPGRVNIERAYADAEWKAHQARNLEKIWLARDRGSSNLEEKPTN